MLNFCMYQLPSHCRNVVDLDRLQLKYKSLTCVEPCVNNFKQWTYFVQPLVKFKVFQKVSCLFKLHRFYTLLWNIFSVYVFWDFNYFYLVFAQDIIKTLWFDLDAKYIIQKAFRKLGSSGAGNRKRNFERRATHEVPKKCML